MTTFRVLLLSFVLLQILISAQVVFADTGPKPSMDFTFKHQADLLPMNINSGAMYECDQVDCSDALPLEELGPQGFRCDTENCSATSYGFAPYHRLEIEFSDGVTRESNIFETAGFNSKYTVTVRADDLLVEAQFSLGVIPPVSIIAITCICVLVGLALIVGLIILIRRRSAQT